MKRQKVDRSETAIPCMLIFTKPLQTGGLPRNLYYGLLAAGVFLTLLFKNIIAGILVLIIYLILKKINAKDETYLIGLLRMCRKKYISY